MVSFDAGFLGLVLYPTAKPPLDPATRKPTARLPERVDALLESLDVVRERVIISTPALSEFLVLVGEAGPTYLSELNNFSNFYVRPFDLMAAVEVAAMELLARKTGSKRFPASPGAPWQKIKVDRQIVAIAKLHGVTTMYSDDGDIRSLAEDLGMKVISCWELELPPSKMPLLEASGKPFDLK
jgi:predicted nucleic acid-binding protein